MKWLLELLSLIKKLLKKLFRREEEEKPTREDFINAVKVLSNDPVWRVKILLDSLDLIKSRIHPVLKWIDRDEITRQWLHRGMGCGMSVSFGDGIYGMRKEDWGEIIQALHQDAIHYVKEFSDCDNFASFFKGFADYVAGKPVVIYTTGMVFKPVEQFGHKVCLCKQDYLLGGHGWNRICVIDEPIDVEMVGTTRKEHFNFTLYNYEPQNDMLGDKFVGNRCYMTGGHLPIFYAKKSGEVI